MLWLTHFLQLSNNLVKISCIVVCVGDYCYLRSMEIDSYKQEIAAIEEEIAWAYLGAVLGNNKDNVTSANNLSAYISRIKEAFIKVVSDYKLPVEWNDKMIVVSFLRCFYMDSKYYKLANECRLLLFLRKSGRIHISCKDDNVNKPDPIDLDSELTNTLAIKTQELILDELEKNHSFEDFIDDLDWPEGKKPTPFDIAEWDTVEQQSHYIIRPVAITDKGLYRISHMPSWDKCSFVQNAYAKLINAGFIPSDEGETARNTIIFDLCSALGFFNQPEVANKNRLCDKRKSKRDIIKALLDKKI